MKKRSHFNAKLVMLPLHEIPAWNCTLLQFMKERNLFNATVVTLALHKMPPWKGTTLQFMKERRFSNATLVNSAANVWCIKNRTKDSRKTLLSLVRVLMHQVLGFYKVPIWKYASKCSFQIIRSSEKIIFSSLLHITMNSILSRIM